jgi:hypothetical protein
MNKRIGRTTATPVSEPEWLDLEGIDVEVTSEDPNWPIEGALLRGRSAGWRAAEPGPQTICLVWREPIRLSRIRLVFEEYAHMRTQEFVLRALTLEGRREVVRQQFTFSPPTTSVEREDYAAILEGVTRLELTIVPAIDGREAIASVKEWRAA